MNKIEYEKLRLANKGTTYIIYINNTLYTIHIFTRIVIL